MSRRVEFGELHLFVGPDFVVTSATPNPRPPPCSPPPRGRTRTARHGAPEAVLYAILDEVVDGYEPVIAGLSRTTSTRSRTQLFDPRRGPLSRGASMSSPGKSRLSNALTQPLVGMLEALLPGSDKYQGRARTPTARSETCSTTPCASSTLPSAFRSILENALTVDATLVAQPERRVRRLSSTSPRTRRSRRSPPGLPPLCPHPHRHRLRHELRPTCPNFIGNSAIRSLLTPHAPAWASPCTGSSRKAVADRIVAIR